MDANNMYLAGRRDATDAPIGLATAGEDLVGRVVDLPRRHAEFEPPDDLGEWPPSRLERIGPASSEEELEAAVEWVDQLAGWFHSVDLPHGVTTPGGRGWEARARTFDIPGRVAGATVLDLGAMEGGDTFMAEASGAQSVTACDVDNYFTYDLGRNAAWDHVVDRFLEARAQGPRAEWAFLNAKRLGFELCRRARGSRATRVSGSVYELDPGIHGTFDVVYCFGLLYHLRHPLLALDRVRAVTGEVALINNQIAGSGEHEIAFFNDTWRGSYTNWFVPTPECFLEMLSSAGFSRLEVVALTENSMSVVCQA